MLVYVYSKPIHAQYRAVMLGLVPKPPYLKGLELYAMGCCLESPSESHVSVDRGIVDNTTLVGVMCGGYKHDT